MLKRIGLALGAILILLQFFQIDKSSETTSATTDFIAIEKPDEKVKVILEKACYDCHSNQTKYPWYSYIQPVGWWLQDHIEEGSEHLDFAKWDSYSAKRKAHKVKEMIEEVEEGEMPLDSYTWVHSEAKLSEDEKTTLINWLKKLSER